MHLVSNLTRTLQSPILQSRLVTSLPTDCSRTQDFARRLALCFFLGTTGYAQVPLTRNDTLTTLIVKRLKSIGAKTNASPSEYQDIAAAVELLDVALGNGFNRPQESKDLSPEDYNTARAHFDSLIDSLVNYLGALSAQIVDTGASHMQRTEAKDAVSRLVSRLEHAVRTKPKPVLHAMDQIKQGLSKGAAAKYHVPLQNEKGRISRFFGPPIKEEAAGKPDSPVRSEISAAVQHGAGSEEPSRPP